MNQATVAKVDEDEHLTTKATTELVMSLSRRLTRDNR